ncbi:MAG: hypothetical protein ACYCZR_02665 [Burkholderiales bacterium]
MKNLVLLLALVSTVALADNSDTCASYNFTPGTLEFSNCMMQLDIAQHQMAAQQAAQMDAQRRAAVMQMYRPIVPYQATPYQMPIPQQTNCRWIGNVWNCQ